MLNTDLFLSSLRFTDWVVITDVQKDFLTNGNIMQRLHQQWSQHDLYFMSI